MAMAIKVVVVMDLSKPTANDTRLIDLWCWLLQNGIRAMRGEVRKKVVDAKPESVRS
jgi:hypothetical protein